VLTLLSGLKSGAMLLADRGFDADWLKALVSQHGAWANIRPMTLYSLYYNETRTHLGLSKDAPLRRAVERSGTIVTTPILSGLHHRYARI
jgi:hypothetical protein